MIFLYVFAGIGLFCTVCVVIGLIRAFPDFLRERRIIGKKNSP